MKLTLRHILIIILTMIAIVITIIITIMIIRLRRPRASPGPPRCGSACSGTASSHTNDDTTTTNNNNNNNHNDDDYYDYNKHTNNDNAHISIINILIIMKLRTSNTTIENDIDNAAAAGPPRQPAASRSEA